MRNWSNNPEETRRKHRENVKKNGNRPPVNWKNGISLNPTMQREYFRSYERNTRNAVLQALGGKCILCGFDDFRALQIDHINGGGSIERKNRTYKGAFHKHVLQSFLKKENKYQLLCANCNWIKRCENREVRKIVV